MSPATNLDPDAGPVLALLSRTPFAWFSDIDGVLSPIVDRPEDASVPEPLRHRLARIAAHIDHLVLVSGRTTTHARDMVPIEGAVYIGNHGLSRLQDGIARTVPAAAAYVGTMAEIERQIAATLMVEGLLIENKGPILALHYRLAPDPEQARQTILEAAQDFAAAQGLLVQEGRMVIELRPPLDYHKGRAISEFIAEHGIRGAIYLGDDITDIDAFRALRALRESGEAETLSIAVADEEVSPEVLAEADYSIDGIAGVERLLEAVAEALDSDEVG